MAVDDAAAVPAAVFLAQRRRGAGHQIELVPRAAIQQGVVRFHVLPDALHLVPGQARDLRHRGHAVDLAAHDALSGTISPVTAIMKPGCSNAGLTSWQAHTAAFHIQSAPRSEEPRLGKECVSTCISRWSPSP